VTMPTCAFYLRTPRARGGPLLLGFTCLITQLNLSPFFAANVPLVALSPRPTRIPPRRAHAAVSVFPGAFFDCHGNPPEGREIYRNPPKIHQNRCFMRIC